MAKKLFTIILVICMALGTAACSSDVTEPEQTEGEPDNQITVSIAATAADTNLDDTIEGFEEETGIQVNLIKQELNQVATVDEAYRQQVLTELMGGAGAGAADVYYLNSLDYNQLGEQGLLYDFSELFGQDDVLNDEVVNLDVLRSTSDDEHVYAVPMSYSFYAMSAKTLEDAEKIRGKNLDWPEFFAETETTERSGSVLSITDYDLFSLWFQQRYDELVDETNTEAPLNRAGIEEMLQQVKGWADQELILSVKRDQISGESGSLYSYGLIFPGSSYILAEDDTIQDSRSFIYPYLIPIPSKEAGENSGYQIFYSLNMYGVNAKSEKKEEAVAFVKYLITSETFNRDKDGKGLFTIDRSILEKNVNVSLEETQKMNVEMNLETVETKVLEKLNTMNFAPRKDGQLMKLIMEEANQYFMEEKELEDTMDSMERTVILYLQEKR